MPALFRRRWFWPVLVLLLVALVGWRLAARRAAAPAAPTAAAMETRLDLAPADLLVLRPQTLALGVPVSGTLKAVNSAVLKARVAGELTGLSVREGDSVRAGQVLARIDPLDPDTRVRQASQQAEAAQAQVAIAQRQADNNRALVQQGFISPTALDTAEANLNAAKSSYQAALSAVALARKTLDDTLVRSPLNGQVAQRLVQPGERVAVDTRLLEVVDTTRFEVEAVLPAGDAQGLQLGQPASLTVEGRPAPVAAKLVRINPAVQAGSRGLPVYLAVEAAPGLRHGLFVQGRLLQGSQRTLAVPVAALRTDKPQPYVQAVIDGRVRHLTVQPGVRGEVDGQPVVAVGGVAEGTLLLAPGVGALRDGTAVKLPEAPAAAPAASAVSAPASAASAAPAASAAR